MFSSNSWFSLKNILGGPVNPRASLQTAARFTALSQKRYLQDLLHAQRQTAYGSAHQFAQIDDVATYQSRVPILDYETLRPWLAEVQQGIPNVLTAEPVLFMRQSRGLTKMVPVTRSLQKEWAAGLQPFVGDWLNAGVGAGDGPWLWESLAAADAAALGPVPMLGAAALHPSRLLPSLQAQLKDLFLGAPQSTQRGRFAYLVQLLGQPELRAMSLGDPGQFLSLVELLQAHLPLVLARLPAERARQIDAAAQAHGQLTAKILWPKLGQVSLWRDGAMAALAGQLAPFFAGIPCIGAPLRCAEAVLSVPEMQPDAAVGAPLAVGSHFFEFIDLAAPRGTPRLAHQLEVGALYVPVVSTSGGLYRYRLDDAVECTGYFLEAPRLRFVDKVSVRSDLVGENLSAAEVQHSLQRSAAQLGLTYTFAMAAPQATGDDGQPAGAPAYTLYIDSPATGSQLEQLARTFELDLCRLPGYWSRRRAHQLAKVRVVQVPNGLPLYRQICATEPGRPTARPFSTLQQLTPWALAAS
jgi:hypothetical protein